MIVYTPALWENLRYSIMTPLDSITWCISIEKNANWNFWVLCVIAEASPSSEIEMQANQFIKHTQRRGHYL